MVAVTVLLGAPREIARSLAWGVPFAGGSLEK
jgi:hypothetical protein